MKQYLGIDIGGTNIKIGVVSGRGDVTARGLLETLPDEGPVRAFGRIHAAANALAPDGIEGAGVGCAGLIDENRGVLTASPNLKAWEGAALARIASAYFSVPVRIQNDASCAAYGESKARGTRGRDLVLITLGTGVGGGIVSDGHLVRGADGFGGEIGHITVDAHGPRCHCGSRGCLEVFAGSYGIHRTARAQLRRSVPAADVRTWRIFQKASEGERWARETVRITGEHLGIGIAILLNLLNPSFVVIGGGAAAGFDQLEPHMRRTIKRHAFRQTIAAARLERALLGNDAGMVGAAMLARDTIGPRRPRR